MHDSNGTKFIFVLGGVLSGLGKGVVTSSIAKLLQSEGYNVTAIKIDPYINIDAGTMRPTEHGEVWVTEDGGEIDQDLGNYERFLDINIPKINNITTGQVYLSVIQKERRLEYGGRDVEVIPDIPNEIMRRIIEGGKGRDFVLVEVGGTTGDVENILFLYAIREIGRKYPAVYVFVTYLPLLKNVGELKTKPTQHAIAHLRETGIFPDFIVTRSEIPIDKPRRWVISQRCFIDEDKIIDDPDMDVVYEVPLSFREQRFGEKILAKFGLEPKEHRLQKWEELVNNLKETKKEVKIGIVGKYIEHGSAEHGDVYISIVHALKHAGAHLGVKPVIKQIQSSSLDLESLKNFDGVIIPGGFGSTAIEGKINAIKLARENNIPFLGLCLGLQMAVIEYARNVCGMDKAHSSEINPNTPYPVIDILPEQKQLMKEKKYGATMRLGGYRAILKEGSLVQELYGKNEVIERHRHRYEVNPDFIEKLESNGLLFSGRSPDRRLMEFLEIPDHKFFIATQAHPEFTSRFENPNPLFLGFVKACLN